MTVEENQPKKDQVTSLRRAGLTYAEIGRRMGLSRERIRQLAGATNPIKKKTVIDQTDILLTTSEAAELLNVHVNTLRRWSDRGVLEVFRLGSRGDRRFRRGDVDRLLRRSSTIN
jgi:excisionase family DNA binding protein